MTSSAFARAQAFVTRMEGGFVNHPADPGRSDELRHLPALFAVAGRCRGRFGRRRRHRRGRYPCPYAGNGSRHSAQKLLGSAQAGQAAAALALVLYDTAVNMGTGKARRLAQQALGVEVDGKWGPKTWKALMSCNGIHTARAILELRRDAYTDLVVENRKLEAFYTGWMRRCTSLEKELLTY